MNSKRGQSAMEFLMTYGWAILIMLVVIAVLFYLGILNPRNVATNSLTFPGGFTAYDFKVSSAGVLTLDLGQATGDTVVITKIACNTTVGNDDGDDAEEFGTPQEINNGEHEVLDVTPTCVNATLSNFYKGKVSIYYYKATSPSITHKIVGDLNHKVE